MNEKATSAADRLLKAIDVDGRFRLFACVTTGIADEACRLHGTSPTASAALGRALTGGALLGALLKDRQRVALKFQGNGPIKKIIVEADNSGALRGFTAVPEADAPLRDGKLNVSGVLGREGFLTVIRDEGFNEPYQGTVKLKTGEIAEDLAYYLTESEQTPSAVGLGVYVEPNGTVAAAGGFLIQTLPPPDEEIIDRLVERLKALPAITTLLRRGLGPEGLLNSILQETPFRILEDLPLILFCPCKRSMIERVLISLGRVEIQRLIDEEETVEVTCEFCRTAYCFQKDEMEAILSEIGDAR
ncbi:MAG: Hsp33 family molecular chaperone HslO [Deltaproteobacteria bacterium]|nr:Hsp33 family molecular chaperone HslO [Deltaproteobacteria bacterium]